MHPRLQPTQPELSIFKGTTGLGERRTGSLDKKAALDETGSDGQVFAEAVPLIAQRVSRCAIFHGNSVARQYMSEGSGAGQGAQGSIRSFPRSRLSDPAGPRRGNVRPVPRYDRRATLHRMVGDFRSMLPKDRQTPAANQGEPARRSSAVIRNLKVSPNLLICLIDTADITIASSMDITAH